MQPIPVDDYQVPHNSHHLMHDVWSLDRENSSMRMKLSVSHGNVTSFRVNQFMRSVANGHGLLDKWEYSEWTFLVFHVGERMALYHVVRGRYNAIPQPITESISNWYKNYTGEFLRAMRCVPEYKIPMDGPWLRIQTIEPILGRECPLFLTMQSARQRWGISPKKTHQRLFKDYPGVPYREYKNWRGMSGYEVLQQYGYLDDK